MRSCCVLGCEINSNTDVIFFEFPTSRALRRKWLDAIQITGKLTVDSVVCSEHFPKTDYEVVRGKVRLKRKVVPSIFQRDEVKKLNGDNNDIDTETDKAQDMKCSGNTSAADKDTPSHTEIPAMRVDRELEKSQHPNSRLDSESNLDKSTNDISMNKSENCLNRNNEGRSKNTHTKSSQTNYFGCESIVKECIQTDMTLDPDPRQDIEEMITNYQIKNKPNKLMSPPCHVPEPVEVVQEPRVVETEPVFIEVAVGKDGRTSEVNTGNRDCLMVLESVQVDIDPSTLMLPEREEESDDDDVVEVTKREDPISLLTSSDEDEVIIEEPQIDTVEVSDEDEDDIPLGTLAKLRPDDDKYPDIAKIMWGLYEYYCLKCKFNTTNRSDYNKHLKVHGMVLQMCQICGYTTSSKSQFTRHKRKHQDEKRFKCHLCSFKSRHRMSLIYHLKTHDGDKKRFACGVCKYETRRRADLKRHQFRLHGLDKDLDSYCEVLFVWLKVMWWYRQTFVPVMYLMASIVMQYKSNCEQRYLYNLVVHHSHAYLVPCLQIRSYIMSDPEV